MTRLIIENLQVGYGEAQILNNLNLSVHDGEMIALLGPSGCGKTTLLNALCGFIPVSGGEIWLDNTAITSEPAEKRKITMVFQSYALWPHMTVSQNIGFGLKVQKHSAESISSRVDEMLSLVGLEGRKNDKVTDLSGGQRQRVALTRALAIRPDVLVLDEPLSNLDAKVRMQVRYEIKQLQEKLGFTSLIVTHDQEEAMVMADRIAVLNQGKIEQIGKPEEIYRKPETPFVADFMGVENKLSWPIPEGKRTFLFRSEAASITPLAEFTPIRSYSDFGLVMSGKVTQSVFFGSHYRLQVDCAGHTISVNHNHDVLNNIPVRVHIPKGALHIFDCNQNPTQTSLQAHF